MEVTKPRPMHLFNHTRRFAQGWYWVMPAHELRRGQIKATILLGRDLAIYRTDRGQVICVDAYCPHMGAHLAEGKIQGESVQCFFHGWQFDTSGQCTHIPCLSDPLPVTLKTWPTAEHYNLIWVWTGAHPVSDLPIVPELKDAEVEVVLGSRFVKKCHPNVLMINAIDEQHFNTVHQLPVTINFKKDEIDQHTIQFHNTSRGEDDFWFIKLIRPLYQEAITYNLCYSFGSTGSVTLGPDRLHFYLMFTLKLREDGSTEGQTLAVTRRRPGPVGWLLNRLILVVTQHVGNYFATGDTQVFQTIRFSLQTPISADRSILQFIHHFERQPALEWGSWEFVEAKGALDA